MTQHLAYVGTGNPNEGVSGLRLPPPPPWREFLRNNDPDDSPDERGRRYKVDSFVADRVNAALYLRRPLLVTGQPGTGKSSLAYGVAAELELGEVLRWPISSKTTLQDGLYQYDAIGRLQAANLKDIESRAGHQTADPVDIGSYIRLGPLGTALLPTSRPRVLLVDELDKGDIDLPNDLLDVFEEGIYKIPELARLPTDHPPVTVMTADEGGTAEIKRGGAVRCEEFPMVIMTSNGERQFPAAFLRRCLQLKLNQPDERQLEAIVDAHLGQRARQRSQEIITEFLSRSEQGELATDQVLNAIFLRFSGLRPAGETVAQLAEAVMPYLNRPPA